MTKERDTYKYQFKVGNKIVHGGITNDLDRREAEHTQTWPKGHIKQVGRADDRESRPQVGRGEGIRLIFRSNRRNMIIDRAVCEGAAAELRADPEPDMCGCG